MFIIQFGWQMDQYVSDNERLREKVKEVGERMEFYKKMVKKCQKKLEKFIPSSNTLQIRPLKDMSLDQNQNSRG